MFDHEETYIGKTFGYNVVGFKSTINQNISDFRTGTSTCKFPMNHTDETKRQSAIRVL